MATHMRSMAQSFDEIVRAEDWEVFNEVSTQEMAQWLLEQAAWCRSSAMPRQRRARRRQGRRQAGARSEETRVSLAKLLAAKAPLKSLDS